MRKATKKIDTLEIVENFPIKEGVVFVDLSDFLEKSYESTSSPSPQTFIVRIQSRFKSDSSWAEELADVQENGNFKGDEWDWDRDPPLLVGPQQDEEGNQIFFLVDGIHRFEARCLGTKHKSYPKVRIMPGDQNTALTEACGAATKGSAYPEQPRNQKDKKRSVLLLIQFPEWWSLSDREIERVLNGTISHTHAQNMRKLYLDMLDKPDELKKWNLQPVENPEEKRYQLAQLDGERTFTDAKGNERVRKRTPSVPKSAGSDTTSAGKRQPEIIHRDTCTFTLEPSVREKALEIADGEGESIQGFFARVVHSYSEWMKELAVLRERLTALEQNQKPDTNEGDLQVSVAHFAGKKEKMSDIYSDNGILPAGYIIRPEEKFIPVGQVLDNGFLKIKVVPFEKEEGWDNDQYLLMSRQDLIYAEDESELSSIA